MIKKLALSLALLVFALSTVPARGANCNAIHIAENTPCVQEQVQPLRDSGTYKETRSTTENADGTVTVTYTFTPKCLNFNPPCGLATRIVTATVDCSTGTATCP